MYKCFMKIDGEDYNAMFLDICEISDFLDANDQDGAETIIQELSLIHEVQDILGDSDFEESYRVEMACLFLLGQAECRRRFHKVNEMRFYLHFLGYLD